MIWEKYISHDPNTSNYLQKCNSMLWQSVLHSIYQKPWKWKTIWYILSANLAPFGTDWAWPEESDFTEMLHGRFSTRNVRQIPGTSCCSIYTPLDLQEAIKLETDILVQWLVLVWTLKLFVQNWCNCNCF